MLSFTPITKSSKLKKKKRTFSCSFCLCTSGLWTHIPLQYGNSHILLFHISAMGSYIHTHRNLYLNFSGLYFTYLNIQFELTIKEWNKSLLSSYRAVIHFHLKWSMIDLLILKCWEVYLCVHKYSFPATTKKNPTKNMSIYLNLCSIRGREGR